MKFLRCIFIFIFILSSYFINGCFPTYNATAVSADTLSKGEYINIQAKLFTFQNTMILFPEGFTISDKHILGNGIEQKLRSEKQYQKNIKLELDSVISMITYEENTTGARYFGSFLFGLTSPILTLAGVYCIACPKCCFGSCPTIYSFDGQNYNLEAELFSECISRQLENSDIDLLRQKIYNGTLSLKITNEALETHYINKFKVFIAEHPKLSSVYPNIRNEITLVKKLSPIEKILNKDGKNISDLLSRDDGIYYRSGVGKIKELKKGISFDYLEMKVPRAANKSTKLVMKYRNTLLSTTLLYDVVLGSQGVAGLEWTRRMNEDAVFAEQFKLIYETFSGIKLKVFNGNSWEIIGGFKDAGPLNWKQIAAEIPKSNLSEQILRLEFIPDNFMVDYIAFDTTGSENKDLVLKEIEPSEIKIENREVLAEIKPILHVGDNNYLKTEPGEAYYLNYNIQEKLNKSQTALIYSEGYYNEWIRGDWIRKKGDYKFDLYDVQGTLSHLADSWMQNSALLEGEFFNSKIILKEHK